MKALAHLLLLAALVPALSLPGFSTERQKDSLQTLRLQKQQAEARFQEQQLRDERAACEQQVQDELNLFRAGKLTRPVLAKSAGTPMLYTVSGTVITEDNGIVPTFRISVRLSSGSWIKDTTFSPGSVTGFRYSFKLPAGTYRFQLDQWVNTKYVGEVYYNDKYYYWDADSIPVTANKDSINFKLKLCGKIGGTVRNSGGYPIAGVYVSANPFVSGSSNSDRTDSTGNYSIMGLAPGNYRVGTQSDSFVNSYYAGKSDYWGADTVKVVGGQTVSNINFSLKKGAIISGRIQAPAGNLIPKNFEVRVIPDSETYWGRTSTKSWNCYIWNVAPRETTYTITGLPAGSYKIMVYPTSGSIYKKQFYPLKSSYEEASSVVLTDGQRADNIDFMLTAGVVIKGRIRTTDHGPLPKQVAIYVWSDTATRSWDYSTYNGFYYSGALTDTTYIIGGLDAGRYTVGIGVRDTGSEYMSQYYGNKLMFSQAVYFNRDENDTAADIDFTLVKGGKISGTIRTSDGNPVPDRFTINANPRGLSEDLADEEYMIFNGFGQSFYYNAGQAPLQVNYSIKGLWEGQYVVNLSQYDDSSSYVDNIYYNNTYKEADATPISLPRAGSASGIDLTFQLGATISGTISTADGKPLPRYAIIWVFDSMSTFSAEQSLSFSDTTPPSSSNYTIRGLAPSASYTIMVSPFYTGSYPDSSSYCMEFYPNAPSAAEAQSIRLSPAENKTGVDFQLETGGGISGRVTDSATGKPVRRASIIALSDGKGDFLNQYLKLGLINQILNESDSNGRYSIRGLRDGAYTIQFLPGLGTDEMTYRAEFYNNAVTPSAAQSISISGKNKVDSVNFKLKSGNWGTVTGALLSDKGDTIRSFPDEALVFAFRDSFCVGFGEAERNGYQITCLPAGDYKIAYLTITGFLQSNFNYKYSLNTRDYNAARTVPVLVNDTAKGVNIILDSTDVGKEIRKTDHVETALFQNSPNPFNPSTQIRFTLSQTDFARNRTAKLRIYNPAGALVRLLDVKADRPGRHQVAWNGKDTKNRAAASGLYIYKLEIGNKVMTRRMVLMK